MGVVDNRKNRVLDVVHFELNKKFERMSSNWISDLTKPDQSPVPLASVLLGIIKFLKGRFRYPNGSVWTYWHNVVRTYCSPGQFYDFIAPFFYSRILILFRLGRCPIHFNFQTGLQRPFDWTIYCWGQFHQHFTSSFCANILSPNKYKAKL